MLIAKIRLCEVNHTLFQPTLYRVVGLLEIVVLVETRETFFHFSSILFYFQIYFYVYFCEYEKARISPKTNKPRSKA